MQQDRRGGKKGRDEEKKSKLVKKLKGFDKENADFVKAKS